MSGLLAREPDSLNWNKLSRGETDTVLSLAWHQQGQRMVLNGEGGRGRGVRRGLSLTGCREEARLYPEEQLWSEG